MLKESACSKQPLLAVCNEIGLFLWQELISDIGSVSISSASMADQPLIDTQTLATSTDQQVAVQVVRRMREMWTTKSYSAITSSADEVLPGPNVQSDDEILNFLLENAGSGFHCACTCKS